MSRRDGGLVGAEVDERMLANDTVREAFVQGYEAGWDRARAEMAHALDHAIDSAGSMPRHREIRKYDWPSSPIAASEDYKRWLNSFAQDGTP